MSLAVVIKGPVAKAGSIFNRSYAKGINVPSMAEKSATIKSEIAKVSANLVSSAKK